MCRKKKKHTFLSLVFQNLYFEYFSTDEHYNLNLQYVRVQTPCEPDQR